MDWLFPIECYGCGQSGRYLCDDCGRKVKRLDKQFCPQCAEPSPGGFVHPDEPGSPIKRLVSLYIYSPPLDQILKDYKYHQVRGLKKTLVSLLKKGLEKNEALNDWREKDFVFIPVPLHPFKELSRGFNQTEEILTTACQQMGLDYQLNLIKRIKWTKTQTKLSFQKRKTNLKNAFKVNSKKVRPGMKVVIFDDVITTGSTLKSCAKSLQKAGIESLAGLTLFRKL